MYRDFKSDIESLDGRPVSEVTGDLVSVALILKKEGFITVRVENERIIYRRTSKADRTIEAMIRCHCGDHRFTCMDPCRCKRSSCFVDELC